MGVEHHGTSVYVEVQDSYATEVKSFCNVFHHEASAVRGEEAGRFRKGVGVSIIVMEGPRSATKTL